MSQPRQDPQHLRSLLRQHRKNLNYLELQAAKHGASVPLDLHNEIEAERVEISRLEAQLEQEETAIASTLELEAQQALPAQPHDNLASLVSLLTALYRDARSHYDMQLSVSGTSSFVRSLVALMGSDLGPERRAIAFQIEGIPGDVRISIGDSGPDRDVIEIAIPVNGHYDATFYYYPAVLPLPADDGAASPPQPLSLPLRAIPDPTTSLPLRSYMPVQHNRFFVGRRNDLQALAAVLAPTDHKPHTDIPIAVIAGPEGIGKSQLACEFVYRYGRYFAGVCWIDCTKAHIIDGEIVKCGRAMGLEAFAQLQPEEQPQRVREAWHSPEPWLLVFDGCEEPSSLEVWRPFYGGARIIVTSREKDWDPKIVSKVHPLDVLDREESITLLGYYRADLLRDRRSLNTLCAAFGDLPMALDLAGRLLSQYRNALSIADYLDELDLTAARQDQLLQEGGEANPVAKHIMGIRSQFALNYRQLDPDQPGDALALALLRRASYFAQSEPLAVQQLLTTIQRNRAERAGQRAGALDRLVKLGLLVLVGDNSVRMHPLLRAVVQQQDDNPDARIEVICQLRGTLCDGAAPATSRRTAAFQLLRIHGLADGPPISTEELLACLDLVVRFVVAPAHHYALIEAITTHLSAWKASSDQRQHVQLLVYRAMLWGKLSDLEGAQEAAISSQSAAADYTFARELNATILHSRKTGSEDWRTEARIILGKANLKMRRFEELSAAAEQQSKEPGVGSKLAIAPGEVLDVAAQESKESLLQQSIELYQEAVEAARIHGQDIVLKVAIYKELSYSYACQQDWSKAVKHYNLALNTLADGKDRIDPQAYVRQLAWVLETASEAHLAKGQNQPKGAHSQQAYRDYLRAYSLTQHEIALLQQTPQQMKSLVLACYNAGIYLREMGSCPKCPVPRPLDETHAYWKSAQELAHRLGMLEWERKLGRCIEQLRREQRESR